MNVISGVKTKSNTIKLNKKLKKIHVENLILSEFLYICRLWSLRGVFDVEFD